MQREPGFYYVRPKGERDWDVAGFNGSAWTEMDGETPREVDTDAEIGPPACVRSSLLRSRITPPEEK